MPNTNYTRGRRVEYELCKLGKQHGWMVARTAGSHGWYDVSWTRPCGVGSVNEFHDHVKGAAWFPSPTAQDAPGLFLYEYFRFTRGIHKRKIWCLPIADGYCQTVFFQVKLRKERSRCQDTSLSG